MSQEAVFLKFQLHLQTLKAKPDQRHFENTKPGFVNTVKRKIEHSIQDYYVHDKNNPRLLIICYLTLFTCLSKILAVCHMGNFDCSFTNLSEVGLNYGNGKTRFLLRYIYLHYSTFTEMKWFEPSQLLLFCHVYFDWNCQHIRNYESENIPTHDTIYITFITTLYKWNKKYFIRICCSLKILALKR